MVMMPDQKPRGGTYMESMEKCGSGTYMERMEKCGSGTYMERMEKIYGTYGEDEYGTYGKMYMGFKPESTEREK